jgi:hypothetical protein
LNIRVRIINIDHLMAALLTPSWTLERARSKLNMGKIPDWDRMFDGLSLTLWNRFSGNADTLDRLYSASPDAHAFVFTLFFAHLLDPFKTPPAVSSWLKHKETVLSRSMTCSPCQLEQGTWRKVPIPLAHEGRGYVFWMMIGVGPDLELFPMGSEIFDDQAIGAIHTAHELVRNKWDLSMAVCPISWKTHEHTIAGPSLGLPVFLGAAAAHNGQPCSKIMATGCLGPDGSVLPVGHVLEKANAAGSDCRLFIHPAKGPDDATICSRDNLETVPVTTVDQACAVLACQAPGLGTKVVAAQRILDQEEGLVQELCGLAQGMDMWVRHHRTAISNRLHQSDNLQPLIEQIKGWGHSTTGTCHELADALLDCFEPDMVLKMGAHDAVAAWDMALLQMNRANHFGMIDLFPQWNRIASAVKPHILRLHQGDGAPLLHAVRIFINDSHNRYDFDPRLPERMEHSMMLEDIVDDMETAFDRKRQRCNGPCEEKVLGQYFGTLGQHFLFCGPEYAEQGMHYLNKAMHAFGDGEIPGDCHKEWLRDLFYLVFALIETERFEEAEKRLKEVCAAGPEGSWPVHSMNRFQIYALLRLHVDSGRLMDAELWWKIRRRISHDTIRGHPVQLIALNLALLAREEEERKRLYHLSLQNCLASGPTIQAMALLPLAHMFAEGMNHTVLEKQCEQVRNMLENSGLHAPHFEPVLKQNFWKDMLETVLARKKELFPYMYR